MQIMTVFMQRPQRISGRHVMEHYLELVRQAKQGDADAFARLYQEVYEDLYRFAVYILKETVTTKGDIYGKFYMQIKKVICT